jgi:hypothetical protein
MTWYKVEMSLEQVANGEHIVLQNQFEGLFMAARGPKDMALFGSAFDSSEQIHLYFSPGSISHAKALIDSYGGSPCDKPSDKRLALLVGHADAMDRLVRGLDT